jgi:hypothetical protein
MVDSTLEAFSSYTVGPLTCPAVSMATLPPNTIYSTNPIASTSSGIVPDLSSRDHDYIVVVETPSVPEQAAPPTLPPIETPSRKELLRRIAELESRCGAAGEDWKDLVWKIIVQQGASILLGLALVGKGLSVVVHRCLKGRTPTAEEWNETFNAFETRARKTVLDHSPPPMIFNCPPGQSVVMTFTEVWNSNGRTVYTRFRMFRLGEVIEFDPEDFDLHGTGAE